MLDMRGQKAGEAALKAREEEAKLEEEYKKAFIHFVKRQVPALIQEMQLLRGAINRQR